MTTENTLAEQLAVAKARRLAAKLTPEQEVTAKMLAELDEELAAARVDEKTERQIRGAAAVGAAHKAAAGRYLVAFVDLGSLLPDADPSTLPGGGVLVVRSPPTAPVDVLATFTREHEARERPVPDLMVDLVLECLVEPSREGPAGIRLRDFFESSVGKGAAISVGNEVTRLGGMRTKEAKRGRE